MCCSDSSSCSPGGALTSGHCHVGSPGPISLPPTSMSRLRWRKYQSQTAGRRAPLGLPSPQSGAGAEERCSRGCKAVSENHRHSELVGVPGSARHSQGGRFAKECGGARRKAGVTPRDTGPHDRGHLQLL